jgi:phospholipase/lecithinase/hemolysin
VKKAVGFMVGILLFGSAFFPAQAAFTSLYVFGDSLSAASNNVPIGPYGYGDRWSNGRVWVEVLAQRQGLPFNPSNNISFFGNISGNMVDEVNSFTPPAPASNVLVVIWVNNADLYYPATASPPTLEGFNTVINQAQTNHYKAITNLYAKGIRTLIMPNVVDISTIPAFNKFTAYTNLFHQASTNYNAAFYATLNRVRTNSSYSGLTIYIPDFFALLTNLLTYPTNYVVTNALKNKLSIDALGYLGNPSLTNGPGTNYIFWDAQDPTAMVHMWMANTAQQLISPVRISKITALNGSNRLDMANVPVGQNGLVIGRTNLLLGNWTTNVNNFNSTNTTQSVFVPASGPTWFYRLSFPYSWTWP